MSTLTLSFFIMSLNYESFPPQLLNLGTKHLREELLKTRLFLLAKNKKNTNRFGLFHFQKIRR